MSVLEVSRMSRRPHLSVCGGRARCTTCRIRVDKTTDDLPPPSELEANALARIAAPDGLRLACQLRPQADLWFIPSSTQRSHTRAGRSIRALQNSVKNAG